MGTVTIGDRDVTVEEPSIYKTELIGERLATVGKDAPEVMSDLGKFKAQYERDNYIELPRLQAMVQVPHLVQGLSESDWNQIGQKVRLPQSPTGVELVLGVLPTVFTKARTQALELVALLMIPDDELPHNPQQVNERVEKDAEWLRFNAKPSALIALMSECTELVREVMEANEEEVKNLRAFWDSATGKAKEGEPQSEHEKALKEAEQLVAGATGGSPSFTDSPPDSDGDTPSATDSPPATPSPSLT